MSSGSGPAMAGYGGYRRFFEREAVSGASRSARPHADFEREAHGLMADSRWASEHRARFDETKLLQHQRAQPGGNTRLQPSHKDARQAAAIVAAAATRSPSHQQQTQATMMMAGQRLEEEKESSFNWQTVRASSAPSDPSSMLPSAAGRSSRRSGNGVYESTYSSSIGVGRTAAAAPRQPHFPYPPAEFATDGRGAMLPPLDQTLNQSLAQAIASLPTAEQLLKQSVGQHSTYARDMGQRGHHPLQRNHGISGAVPPVDPSHITMAHARSTYPQAPPSHEHLFPSRAVIGPSGARIGPSPIEGSNDYPHTSYEPTATGGAEASGSPTASSPFTRGSKASSSAAVSVSVCETATTRELFLGSSKATNSVRIPNYGGFIPAADSNQLSLTGVATNAAAQKDILHTYRHDMPGYSGHQPQSVVNLRGPRSPRGKQRLNEGLVASLILDSMKI